MLYTVSFLNSSSQNWEISRHFSTLRAARKWSVWLSGHSYCAEAAIYRGGPGGERVA